MTIEMPHVRLARSWNIPDAMGLVTRTAHAFACHWTHNLRELPSAVIPANTLFLRFKPAHAWRINGNRREVSAYARNGIGLMAEGSYGRWEYAKEQEVDLLHIYLSNAHLSTLANLHDIGIQIELRNKLELNDPLLRLLCIETAEVCRDDTLDPLYADTLALALGLRLIKRHAIGSATVGGCVGKSPPAPLPDWQVKRVRGRILESMTDEISLAALADECRLSPFHFARAFKAATGLPPHRYSVVLRLKRACELLEKTSLSLANIAGQIGFTDPSYFGRVFRKHFGYTPAEYRRSRRT